MKKTTGFKGALKTWMLGACALGMLGAGSAQAALINAPGGSPDIVASSLSIEYDASGTNGVLTASAAPAALAYDADGAAPPEIEYLAGYTLTAEIDKTTGVAISGSLDIDGDGSATLGSTALSSLTLSQVGFDTTLQAFDFLFSGLSGTLAPDYGDQAYVVLSNFTGFTALDASFSDQSRNAAANNRAVPLPGSALLLLIGAVGMGAIRRVS